AQARPHMPVLLVMAIFSRHAEILAEARTRLEQLFGPVQLAGPPFVFDQTSYYEASMGPDLRKQFLAFRDLVAPERLPDIKLRTNALEEELAAARRYPEARPLNVDPGLLELGKFLLATTKDQAHRVYLRDGIFAEVTLRYHAGGFEPWPWTYADYRLPCVHDFLQLARDYYRQRLRDERTADERD
ncbi:MAG: DUF4416 family protein, partial [Gemmataceae bacterium]